MDEERPRTGDRNGQTDVKKYPAKPDRLKSACTSRAFFLLPFFFPFSPLAGPRAVSLLLSFSCPRNYSDISRPSRTPAKSFRDFASPFRGQTIPPEDALARDNCLITPRTGGRNRLHFRILTRAFHANPLFHVVTNASIVPGTAEIINLYTPIASRVNAIRRGMETQGNESKPAKGVVLVEE